MYMCDGSVLRAGVRTSGALCGATAIGGNAGADSASGRRVVSDGGIVVNGKAATIAADSRARSGMPSRADV